MIKKLEYLTYICLISISFISGIILVHNYIRTEKSNTEPPRNNISPEALIGKNLTQILGTSFASHKPIIAVFVSTKCSFCEASIPFYKRMSGELKKAGNKVIFIAISREKRESSINTTPTMA